MSKDASASRSEIRSEIRCYIYLAAREFYDLLDSRRVAWVGRAADRRHINSDEREDSMGLLDRVFGPKTIDEKFVNSPMRDNWYQASSYWPSSFSLITTVSEDGSTNIGPYQLTFPFEVIKERSFLVCSRKGSNTETNLHRNPRCAMHFIEFNRRQLSKIVGLGYPGQTTGEKMADSPFTLIESPTPGRGTADGYPLIIKEAFQVHEAHWDESFTIKDDGRTPEYLVLRLENILLKETWAKNIENGTNRMPNMPITFGFRDGEKFWFAERKRAFWFPTPTDKGAREESVLYEANRIDPEVKFTREACKQLTGIPKPFIKTALKGIIKQAKERGVTEIDREFVEMLNRERS